MFTNMCEKFIRSCYGEFWVELFLGFLVSSLCFVHAGGIGLDFYLLWCTRLGSCWCAFFWLRPWGEGRLGRYLHDLWEESMTVHNTAAIIGIGLRYFLGQFFKFEAMCASLGGTAQSPWLFCMYGLLE